MSEQGSSLLRRARRGVAVATLLAASPGAFVHNARFASSQTPE
ncbi:hypothetical protein [Paraburkholderia kirstenboschensis]|nr:hypothetical protein [Paraburkholderia kirstenboschensis]